MDVGFNFHSCAKRWSYLGATIIPEGIKLYRGIEQQFSPLITNENQANGHSHWFSFIFLLSSILLCKDQLLFIGGSVLKVLDFHFPCLPATICHPSW